MLWTLAAFLAPLAAAAVAIPVLFRTLGPTRFGFVSIAWATVGGLSLLDLGLGRAVTHAVSRGSINDKRVLEAGWTSVTCMASIGIICSAALWIEAPPLTQLLKFPPGLGPELDTSTRLIALAVPLLLASAGMRGILEGRFKFRDASLIRAGIAALHYGAPLAAVLFGGGLVAISATIVGTRLLGAVALAVATGRSFPFRPRYLFGFRAVLPILKTGGWMSVSNGIAPFVVTLDRLFLGAVRGLAAAGVYAPAAELSSKLWILASAVGSVLFPAMSRTHGQQQPGTTFHYEFGLRVMIAAVLIPSVILEIGARPIMNAWLGGNLDTAADALTLLVLGVSARSIAYVSFNALQAIGRADLTAKYTVALFVPFVAGLVPAISLWGVVGTAAWVAVRDLAELALLTGVAAKLFRKDDQKLDFRGLLFSLAATLTASALFLPVLVRASVALVLAGLAARQLWMNTTSDERTSLRRLALLVRR